ncbi:MAG: ABC transporter ATP-binding protein, partial [Lachnospiraceae bacterium]|nr:ABC transporter ATP-binding protein [Lachnospiraceae bacterium]
MIGMMRRILRVTDAYKGRIRLAFFSAFLKSMLSRMPMMISFYLVVRFMRKDVTVNTCLFVAGLLVLCVLLQCLFQYIADSNQSTAGYIVFADMRKKLAGHLRRLPMGYYTEGNIGKVSSVLSTDMVFIEENLMVVIADLMGYLFAAAIMVLYMFFFHVLLGIVCLAVTVFIWWLGEQMKDNTLAHSRIRQDTSEEMTEAVLDFTEGMGIIKTYNLLGEKSKDLTGAFEKSCDRNIDFEIEYSPYARRINVSVGVGTILMLAAALFAYYHMGLPGTYFIGLTFFLFELFAPLKSFYGQVARLTVMDSCLDRIEAVFREVPLADEGSKTLPAQGEGPEISFDHVTFAYEDRDVLRDISFDAAANTMTALVGASGSGKTTVANLLARFWDVKEGSVRLRGCDIKDLPLAVLMDQISMVFQRVYLFRDTIRNNIMMGRSDATEEEMIAAAKKARCYEFIMALPEGFDTIIGEGGASLSGGEAQRISIARCILKDAPVVILDEATASVDADNEVYIQEAISELVKGKTLIVIAHRLHTIAGADQI